MKKSNLVQIVGLCVILALITPYVMGEEEKENRMPWMPLVVDEQGHSTQDLGGEQIIPEITITKTPKPTADMSKFTKEYVLELKKFNISNDGTNADETSKGINAALQHVKTLDVNRVVFPKGTYLISETDPIIFDHTNTIVDLNGSTLQMRTNGQPHYTMVQIIDGAENFRLTNGTLRGDRDTHDMTTIKGSHEHCRLLYFFAGRNLEVDHMKFTKSASTSVGSGAVGNRNRQELLDRIMHSIYVKDLEQGAFSDKGIKIDSTEKTRSVKPYDMTKCGGEFEFGYVTGYQGYPFIRGRVYQAYFYDKEMNFLEMKKCLQFRKVTIPENAVFMHLEINQPEVTDEPAHYGAAGGSFIARITNYTPPVDVHFHDNIMIDNRNLGLGYCGGQRWLIENCVFEQNGPDIVGWGIDFEDGWELMQDVVLRNNVFKGNLRGDVVICAGTELLFEGNTFSGNLSLAGRPHNYIFRNNTFTGGQVTYTTRTGVAKIHDNTYENCNVSIVFDTKAVADGLYRKPGETVVTPPLILKNETMTNVSKITGTYFNFKNAKLKNSHFIAGDKTSLVNLENCTFDEVSIEYLDKGPDVHVTIKNCKGELKEEGPGMKRKKPAK